MTHKQACLRVVADEPDILRLEQLIAGRWGVPGAAAVSQDAAPRVSRENHPVVVTLDTGHAGQKAGKAPGMSVVLAGDDCRKDDQGARENLASH